MERHISLWNECSELIKSQVSEATWNTWLSGIEPKNIDGELLQLSVPSSLVKDRVETRYLGIIEETVAECNQKPLKVQLVIRETIFIKEIFPENSISEMPKSTDSSTQNATKLVNRQYIFDSFVIGPSNRFAHAAAMSVAESPGKSYNPLFIHGDAGLGKTHLLHAIGNYILEHFPALLVRYVSTETFMNEFVDSLRSNTPTAFKRRYRECDVLLVDDVQFMERKEQLQEEFFHTFNSLYGASKQVVITSDRPPKALATIEDRLKSRFLSGLITDIQPPELETRLAILRSKAEKAKLQVPDDVLEFIASNVKENIRELEGALIRVSAYASLNNLVVSSDLAASVLVDILSNSEPKQITPKMILDAVSEAFGFPIEEIKGPSRRKPLVHARQIGMYVFRELTNYSYPSIGKEFGNRDHTTVIYAVDKIANKMGEKRSIYDQVTALVVKIKSNNG